MADTPPGKAAEKVADAGKSAGKAGKSAGKGLLGKLKGHNKYVYVAGAVVLIGLAYMAFRRGTSGEVAEPTDEELGMLPGEETAWGASAGSSGGGGGYSGVSPSGSEGAVPSFYEDPPFEYYDPGPVIGDTVPENPETKVLVEFAAAPLAAVAANRKKPKKRANPTGGGNAQKRPAAKGFHPKDKRHAGNVGRAVGGALSRQAQGSNQKAKERAKQHVPQKPSDRHQPKKNAAKPKAKRK